MAEPVKKIDVKSEIKTIESKPTEIKPMAAIPVAAVPAGNGQK